MDYTEYINAINEIDLKNSKPTLKISVNKEEFQKTLSSKYESSPHIVKSIIIDEIIEQDNIKYLIKYLKIDNTKNKPILINKKEFKDPFAPPLAEDMIVSDNFCNFPNFLRLMKYYQKMIIYIHNINQMNYLIYN